MRLFDNMFNEIEQNIEKFIRTFQANPFNFLSESDIHGILFTRIYDLYEQKAATVDMVWEMIPAKKKTKKEGTVDSINPVKSEYPYSITPKKNGKGLGDDKFDIAIVSDNFWTMSKCNKFRNAKGEKDRGSDMLWSQYVSFGIEIKHARHFEHFNSNQNASPLNGFKADIEKIKAYRDQLEKEHPEQHEKDPFTGISLLFSTLGDDRTFDNRISKYSHREMKQHLEKNGFTVSEEERFTIPKETCAGWIVFPHAIFRYPAFSAGE